MQGLAVDEVQEFISRLALVGASEAQVQTMSDASDNPADTVADTDADDRARIALLSALESLKAAAAAAQARIAVEFDRSQRQAQREAGVPSAKVGLGIAEQIALARRESPTRGSRLLGLAKALVHELPHTLAALSAGEVSEWRATIIAQATAVLSADDRQVVDARLAGRLATMSDRQVRAASLAAAYELDPRSVVDRAAYAVTQRRVTLRPAPDTMAYLTALLPAAQAVAVFAALHAAAGAARAEGDARSAEQVKADTLVERVTGQSSAPAVPVEIGLVMTDRALLAGDHTPAVLSGYGPIPASHARTLAGGSSGAEGGLDEARVWIRRLYLDPDTRVITDADRRRRLFPTHRDDDRGRRRPHQRLGRALHRRALPVVWRPRSGAPEGDGPARFRPRHGVNQAGAQVDSVVSPCSTHRAVQSAGVICTTIRRRHCGQYRGGSRSSARRQAAWVASAIPAAPSG